MTSIIDELSISPIPPSTPSANRASTTEMRSLEAPTASVCSMINFESLWLWRRRALGFS